MKRERRCGVILRYQNQVLCVFQKSSGFIGFPKGSKESLETDEECAARELFEETGIRISSESLIMCTRWNVIHNHIYFEVMIDDLMFDLLQNFEIKDVDEIEKVEWLDLYGLQHKNIASFTRSLLNRIIRKEKTVSLKNYLLTCVEEIIQHNKALDLESIEARKRLQKKLDDFDPYESDNSIDGSCTNNESFNDCNHDNLDKYDKLEKNNLDTLGKFYKLDTFNKLNSSDFESIYPDNQFFPCKWNYNKSKSQYYNSNLSFTKKRKYHSYCYNQHQNLLYL